MSENLYRTDLGAWRKLISYEIAPAAQICIGDKRQPIKGLGLAQQITNAVR